MKWSPRHNWYATCNLKLIKSRFWKFQKSCHIFIKSNGFTGRQFNACRVVGLRRKALSVLCLMLCLPSNRDYPHTLYIEWASRLGTSSEDTPDHLGVSAVLCCEPLIFKSNHSTAVARMHCHQYIHDVDNDVMVEKCSSHNISKRGCRTPVIVIKYINK